tara:strand:+ start:149 stop:400 length:252 start_codon:yes stop_codon:yes gene_type:complete
VEREEREAVALAAAAVVAKTRTSPLLPHFTKRKLGFHTNSLLLTMIQMVFIRILYAKALFLLDLSLGVPLGKSLLLHPQESTD